MKKCSRCGHKLSFNAKFCSKCGYEIVKKSNNDMLKNDSVDKNNFQSQKRYLTEAVVDVAKTATDFKSFCERLNSKYGIVVSNKGNKYSYHLPERERNITEQVLGEECSREYLEIQFSENHTKMIEKNEIEGDNFILIYDETQKSVSEKIENEVIDDKITQKKSSKTKKVLTEEEKIERAEKKKEREKKERKQLIIMYALLLIVSLIIIFATKSDDNDSIELELASIEQKEQIQEYEEDTNEIPIEENIAEEYDTFDWESLTLNKHLPKPKNDFGYIITDNENDLVLCMQNVLRNDYEDYLAMCENYGIIYESSKEKDSYCAYDDNSYCLKLLYNDEAGELRVELNAPMAMEEMVMPESRMAKLLPTRDSLTGTVMVDTDEEFSMYMGQMNIEEYNFYVEKCKEAGFNVSVNQQERKFTAENSEGYSLIVEYPAHKIIHVSILAPTHEVKFTFAPVDNFMYSDYDVNIYIDGEKAGTMKESDGFDVTKGLKQGKYTICFEKAENSNVKKNIEIEVNQEATLKFVVYRSSEIFVDYYKPLSEGETRAPEDSVYLESYDYKELGKAFEEAGFTNINYEVIYDLQSTIWGEARLYDIETVSINGISDFGAVDIFNKEDSVVITYHDYEMNDPDIEYKSYTAKQLYKDLNDNPARAEKNHKDEYVIVTGVIAEISKSGDVFTISDNGYAWTFDGISCNIKSEKLEEKLLDFSVGDKVKVKGKIKGVNVIFPYLIEVCDFE